MKTAHIQSTSRGSTVCKYGYRESRFVTFCLMLLIADLTMHQTEAYGQVEHFVFLDPAISVDKTIYRALDERVWKAKSQ